MDKNYYKEYYHLERSHWWFTARLKILEAKTKQLLKGKSNPKILNIGIATGATTTMLQKHGQVSSLEYDKDCCEFVREQCNIQVVQGSMTDLPFQTGTFDLVCAFDVVEHIEDDSTAIKELKRVLSPTGKYFLTVPAFMFLWSKHDEINHHYRRYTKTTLKSLLSKQSIPPTYLGYFNSLLFIPIALVRIVQKTLRTKETSTKKSDFDGMNSSGAINGILKFIFLMEKPFLIAGLRLPFGISIMAIGNNKS